MRNPHLVLVFSTSILAACSQQQPAANPTLQDQSTPTNTWGTTYTTDTAPPAVTTTPANAAVLSGLDPFNAVSNCNVDPTVWGDPINDFANMSWNFRMGGPIAQDVLDAAAGSLDPIDQYLGAALSSSLFTEPVNFVTFAVEVDNDMNVPVDAAGLGTYIPAANMLSENGLAQGYHIAWVPWIFTVTPPANPNPNYMEVGSLTMTLSMGVNPGSNLTQVFINETPVSSQFEIRLGLSTWTGDPDLTSEYCSVTYFLDGQSVTPL